MDWKSALAEVERLLQSGAVTVASADRARLLVAFSRDRYPPPDGIGENGYMRTICFHWADLPVPTEIEAGDADFELYRFSDGETAIRHVAASSVSEFPNELSAALDAIFILGSGEPLN